MHVFRDFWTGQPSTISWLASHSSPEERCKPEGERRLEEGIEPTLVQAQRDCESLRVTTWLPVAHVAELVRVAKERDQSLSSLVRSLLMRSRSGCDRG